MFFCLYIFTGCLLSVVVMEAPVCDQWNVLIPTPTNGACVHRCQRGGEEWVWPHITVSCMQSEDMMHQLQAIVLVCLIVWRGKLQ